MARGVREGVRQLRARKSDAIRALVAERAHRVARRAALERAYERATDSNNPLWIGGSMILPNAWTPIVSPSASRFASADHTRTQLIPTRREDVTIVFADLVGFTQRAVELDPEAVMSTVRGLFELAMPVMLRHRVTPITYVETASLQCRVALLTSSVAWISHRACWRVPRGYLA